MANTAMNKAQLRQQRQKQEENKRKYEEASGKALKIFLIIFGLTALLSLVTLILMLVTDAVYIHNTGMTENGGREVAVGGAAFLKALFTGTYTSVEPGYDDLASPFYYYAEAWCVPAAIFALICLIAIVLTLVASGVALLLAFRKKEFRWTILPLVASALCTVLCIVFYAICLSMSGSQILPIYCSGNPACSIQSDLLWCVLLSVVMLAGNVFALTKYLSLEKQRKAIGG